VPELNLKGVLKNSIFPISERNISHSVTNSLNEEIITSFLLIDKKEIQDSSNKVTQSDVIFCRQVLYHFHSMHLGNNV
jgi:hypothetical protein